MYKSCFTCHKPVLCLYSRLWDNTHRGEKKKGAFCLGAKFMFLMNTKWKLSPLEFLVPAEQVIKCCLWSWWIVEIWDRVSSCQIRSLVLAVCGFWFLYWKPEVSYTLLGSGLWLVMLGHIRVEIVCSLQDEKWISVLLDTGELRLWQKRSILDCRISHIQNTWFMN